MELVFNNCVWGGGRKTKKERNEMRERQTEAEAQREREILVIFSSDF